MLKNHVTWAKGNQNTKLSTTKKNQPRTNSVFLLPVAIRWKITGIGSVVTNTSSSFSELDTYVLSA